MNLSELIQNPTHYSYVNHWQIESKYFQDGLETEEWLYDYIDDEFESMAMEQFNKSRKTNTSLIDFSDYYHSFPIDNQFMLFRNVAQWENQNSLLYKYGLFAGVIDLLDIDSEAKQDLFFDITNGEYVILELTYGLRRTIDLQPKFQSEIQRHIKNFPKEWAELYIPTLE